MEDRPVRATTPGGGLWAGARPSDGADEPRDDENEEPRPGNLCSQDRSEKG